jgi:hypothetical protein
MAKAAAAMGFDNKRVPGIIAGALRSSSEIMTRGSGKCSTTPERVAVTRSGSGATAGAAAVP